MGDVSTSAGVTNSAGVVTSAGVTPQSGVVQGPLRPTVGTPQFSPAPGAYGPTQSVTITTATLGATIKYTTDGSTPSPTHGTTYTVAISVAATTTIKAIAYNGADRNSAVATGAYTINGAVATPVITLAAGTYNNDQTTTITCATTGAAIHYTTDGSTPTVASALYSGAVSIGHSMTLKAKAFRNFYSDSSTASAAYVLQVATPTFSPVAGTYLGVQSVTVSTVTTGSSLYYTTDGSTPTTGSTPYTGAISVSSSETVKVLGVKTGYSNSVVGSADYVIEVMPSGALGIWYTNQWDSATNAIPNTILGNPLSTNLFRASRRVFSYTNVWTGTNTVIVDDAATAPDGSNDASTVTGTGNWLLLKRGSTVDVPAGTFTIAVNAKRNTGTNQVFAFTADNSVTHSPVKTATSVWQRFSYTFTKGSVWSLSDAYLSSSDGATDANLQICDLEIFPGAVDLGPVGADGNLYLGAVRDALSPVVSGNLIDMTGHGYGFTQEPSVHTLTSATAVAVFSKTAAGSNYQGFLSKIQAYNEFSAVVDVTLEPQSLIGTTTLFDTDGLWELLNQGVHMITQRYDGVNATLLLDDILLFTKAATVSAYDLADMFVGLVNSVSLYSGLNINAMALYGRALTDAEVRMAYTVLSANAVTDGLTMADARILVPEGDSITGVPDTYPFLYGPNASPAVLGNNVAVAGAVIGNPDGSTPNSLFQRAPMVDAIIPPTPGARKFILTVLIGANDLVSLGAPTYLANLATYCDQRRAAGYLVGVITMLPQTAAGFNTQRNIANPELRLWTTGGSVVPGVHCDFVVDFAANATMGPDAAASDTTYYTGGLHPTATGQAILETVYEPVVNAI